MPTNLILSLTLGVRLLSGIFGKNKRLNARCFAREYFRSCSGYGHSRRVKRCGKSSSLQSKKNSWEVRFFASDVISGGILGDLGPLCLALGANR